MTDAASRDDVLAEYEAARAKLDDAVAALAARSADALRCARGCAACCADGLTVLPVEAHAITRFLGARDAPPVAGPSARGCAFLDDTLACTIYPARPFLCRTHGLALRTARDDGRRALTVVDDDVSTCELNFTARRPTAREILDATAVQALLTTVDARYRARTGADDARVSLRSLAYASTSSSSERARGVQPPRV